MKVNRTIERLPPAPLREAVAALWRIRPPGPRNLFKAPEFAHLRDLCASLYPKSRVSIWALMHGLDALGLPSRPPPADPDLALSAGIATARLHAAFERSHVTDAAA
jgi:hypothetical protein